MALKFQKYFLIMLACCYHANTFGQQGLTNLKYNQYDSLTLTTFLDHTHELNTYNEAEITITGVHVLSANDAKELNKRIKKKSSFGASQAITPVYDLKIIYYKNGAPKEQVLISLWTSNLNASFPIIAQRQGFCACSGNSGSCCSNGGMNLDFKKYLIQLLEKYTLPVDSEGILNFGQ